MRESYPREGCARGTRRGGVSAKAGLQQKGSQLSPPALSLSLFFLLQLPPTGRDHGPGGKLRSYPLLCIILYFPLALGSSKELLAPRGVCECGQCGCVCPLPLLPTFPTLPGPGPPAPSHRGTWKLSPLPEALTWPQLGPGWRVLTGPPGPPSGCSCPCAALAPAPEDRPSHWSTASLRRCQLSSQAIAPGH